MKKIFGWKVLLLVVVVALFAYRAFDPAQNLDNVKADADTRLVSIEVQGL